MRQLLLWKSLRGKYVCTSFGIEEVDIKEKSEKDRENIEQIVSRAENLLLPIPMCKGEKLNIQHSNKEITKKELLEYIQTGQRIFGGCIDKEWKSKAEEKGAVCYDYMEEQTIAVYNSIATAEGTIAEIIRTCPRNLHATKVLVLGFGKCARTLAEKLKAMDAKVTVAARNEAALMEAYASGYDTIMIKHLSSRIQEYSLIVNTIPARILEKSQLSLIGQNTIIYEIASAPYGVDVEAAKELGVMVVVCPALPAKYAPVSSAEILEQYIMKKQGGSA